MCVCMFYLGNSQSTNTVNYFSPLKKWHQQSTDGWSVWLMAKRIKQDTVMEIWGLIPALPPACCVSLDKSGGASFPICRALGSLASSFELETLEPICPEPSYLQHSWGQAGMMTSIWIFLALAESPDYPCALLCKAPGRRRSILWAEQYGNAGPAWIWCCSQARKLLWSQNSWGANMFTSRWAY